MAGSPEQRFVGEAPAADPSPDPSPEPSPLDPKVEMLHDMLGRAASPSPPVALTAIMTLGRSIVGNRRVVVTLVAILVVALGVTAVVVRRSSVAPVELRLPRAVAETSLTPPTSTGGSGSAGEIAVYVVGAVVHPGVVTLPAGSRIADALTAAGGATTDADLRRVNLAAKVVDGQQIDVPRPGETPVVAVGATSSDGGQATPTGPLDLNAATVSQLDTLPGVGPSTAAAITAYRSEHGRFRSVDELDEVRGIGPARMEQLRELVTVGP